MDAYSGYNQIRMDPLDARKIAFMSNHDNYYYNIMSFRLKNACITYQWLMDAIFFHHNGRNLEVYIDNMIIKMMEGHSHANDLEDILQLVRRYNMHLNPAKCSFRVQVGKFLCFMLTRRGIKANPDKCQEIIDMKIPTNMKEV